MAEELVQDVVPGVTKPEVSVTYTDVPSLLALTRSMSEEQNNWVRELKVHVASGGRDKLDEFRRGLAQQTKTLVSAIKLFGKSNGRRKRVRSDANPAEPSPDAPVRFNAIKSPIPVSEELLEFCGWEANTLHARNDVNKSIIQYVKDKNLQTPENKRMFRVDERLQKLFRCDPDTVCTFFNMQKYLKFHYPRKSATLETLPEESVVPPSVEEPEIPASEEVELPAESPVLTRNDAVMQLLEEGSSLDTPPLEPVAIQAVAPPKKKRKVKVQTSTLA